MLLHAAAILNEPRYARWFYLAALLLCGAVQCGAIVCLVAAWNAGASNGACIAFFLCSMFAVCASQHWLQLTTQRYFAPPSRERSEEDYLVNVNNE